MTKRGVRKRHVHAERKHDDRLVLVAFVSFLLMVLFLFDAMNNGEIVSQTDYVLKKLIIADARDDGFAFVVKDTVDDEKFITAAHMDYDDLKTALDITGEFSVFFEDEAGNVVPIQDVYCIGSPRTKIAGIPCG